MVSLEHAVIDKNRNGARGQRRKEGIPNFVGVDGEGVTGPDGVHKYVLLGVGNEQISNPGGLDFRSIMGHLYAQYERLNDPVFVGFFLSYDFAHWMKDLPKGRAWSLFIEEGIQKRQRVMSRGNTVPFPVRYDGWEFDALGMRRLKLRPMCCEEPWKCDHKSKPWMYVNDAGSFWQTSLLSAINPKKWPDGPVVTNEEFEILKAGKERRSVAELDSDMRMYNALENDVLARLMSRQAQGLMHMGIRLSKDQWYGPGQASAEWLKQNSVVRRKDTQAEPAMMEACRRSYIAGWFELFAHGKVEGDSYGYDINSAYPWIMSNLPCLEHGNFRAGKAREKHGSSGYTLIQGIVRGSNPHIGAMLHRTPKSNICRPHTTRGTFWLHELQAAKRAGLVNSWTVTRWWNYEPCTCRPPLEDLAELYTFRQSIGKDTAAGKAAKLVYNSMYGKFAQSVGSAPYGNWMWASLITSGCRVKILEAIATHPGGTEAVLMVATDAVYFSSPHPELAISDKLGEWDESIKRDLFLFKPGFYWDANSKGEATYKSRGIKAVDFAEQIPKIEWQFSKIAEMAARQEEIYEPPFWPFARFYSSFSMVTPSQALRRGQWEKVAEPSVCTCGSETSQHEEGCQAKKLLQSSNPETKRIPRVFIDKDNGFLRTPVYEVAPGGVESKPYEKQYADEMLPKEEDISPDGGIEMEWNIAMREIRGEG